MLLVEHWRDCFRALGLSPPDDLELTRLVQRYSEPHRSYHTVQHLDECFRTFETVRDHAPWPGAVGIALFYHDAIYDTHARDNNEEKSAVLACHILASTGAEASLSRMSRI